jgi:hypothetical protein
MLQKIKWFENKNTIIINNKEGFLASLQTLNKTHTTCAKKLNEYSLIGSVLNTKHDLANIHLYSSELVNNHYEYEFSFCNNNGCTLPTKNLLELF